MDFSLENEVAQFLRDFKDRYQIKKEQMIEFAKKMEEQEFHKELLRQKIFELDEKRMEFKKDLENAVNELKKANFKLLTLEDQY